MELTIPDAHFHRPKSCLIPECGKSVLARGLCKKHYAQWWRRGGTMDGTRETETRALSEITEPRQPSRKQSFL